MLEQYPHGWWSCSYTVSPIESPPSLAQLRQILQEIKGHETGWPVWLSLDTTPEMTPHVVDDVIECWLRDTEDADYWRADPKGHMFLLRRLQEDTGEMQGVEPGTVLDVTLPVWRTGECLLHAARLAARVGAQHVELAMTWHGLEGRELRTIASPRRRAPLFPGRVSHENEVRTTIGTVAAGISDTLPELVQSLTAPLYARFNFFEPASEFYVAEVGQMRKGI
jgi:hypothetical protein